MGNGLADWVLQIWRGPKLKLREAQVFLFLFFGIGVVEVKGPKLKSKGAQALFFFFFLKILHTNFFFFGPP